MRYKNLTESLGKPFIPLKHSAYRKKFVLYSMLFLVLFNVLSSLLVAIVLKGFEGNIVDKLIFAFLKNVYSMMTIDWALLITGSVLASLMTINYQFNKCTDKKSISAVFLGTITATCPTCIIPIIGIAGLTTFIGTYNYLIKFGVIALLFIITVYVANKDNCKVRSGIRWQKLPLLSVILGRFKKK